jgi:hypothetical protein
MDERNRSIEAIKPNSIEAIKPNIPWKFFVTYILHDNSLVSTSDYGNVENNNLVIESKSSDIRFFVSDNKKIEFNGVTAFKNDVSFAKNTECKDIIINNANVNGDISINGSLYLNNISIQSMENKLASLEDSYNRMVNLANIFGINI